MRGREISILAYHKVDTRGEFGITNISPKAFEKQVKYLQNQGYISISPDLLINYLFGSGQSPLPPKAIFITFDDGYESIYQYAYPILVEHGFVATIFLLSGYIDRWNSWDVGGVGRRFKHLNWGQILDMAQNGFSFGSHGVNHKFLTRAKKSEILYELTTSKSEIEDKLGCKTRFFSYPYGNYNQKIKDLVRDIGYDGAFCLKPNLEIHLENLYSLPRTGIYLLDSFFDFKAKLEESNRAKFKFQAYKNLLINRCSYASLLIKAISNQ